LFKPCVDDVFVFAVQALADMLVEVCKNPKSPGFNHYLFEAVAALIKHGVAADRAQLTTFEGTLFPAFDIVLRNDVQEFHPYIFQILAQLIELSTPPLCAVRLGDGG
jgi:exportin-2 (importin alpha re-exporter)